MEYKFKNIGIETTNICNNRCVVCPRETKFNRPLKTMDFELFKKIILDIHNNKIEKTIRLSGMGDSSCDKQLIERLRFCKQHTPDLDIVVLSNMGVWPQKYSDIIIEEKLLSKIRFSVFAVSEEASLKVYGDKKQAMKAQKNINYFFEKNKVAGSPVKTLLYTLKLDEVPDELDLIKKEYWDKLDEFEVWQPHNWSNLMPGYRIMQSKRRDCYRVEDFEASIRANGDVCACSMDINHNIVYGNLNDQTLEEIYESEAYKKIRDINRAGQIESIDICNNCSFLNGDESEVLVETKTTCDTCK